jgi:hypothetical protein
VYIIHVKRYVIKIYSELKSDITHNDVYILYIKIIIFKDPYWIIYIYIVSDDSLFISCRLAFLCAVFSHIALVNVFSVSSSPTYSIYILYVQLHSDL